MKTGVIATHDGEFHADEIFAIAILKLIYKKVKIVRTRSKKKFLKADFRIDVGRKYNPKTKDYDHHQLEFNLKRKNGIPYASAGLIWKHLGKKLTNSEEAFNYIDAEIVQPIDAGDNGFNISDYKLIFPYTISDVISCFNPRWNEKKTKSSENSDFNRALKFASIVLEREIKKANSFKEGEKIVRKELKKNQEFLVLNRKKLPWWNVVSKKPKIKFVIFPEKKNNWVSVAVAIKEGSFDKRALFPKEWAGSEEDLEEKTNVKGARFCHKGRFIIAATTKEGAIELTKLALKKK